MAGETVNVEGQKKLPEHYEGSISDPEVTGLRLFGLADKNTGVKTYFVEFNSDIDVHTTIPWVGARTSRSPDNYVDIFAEIREAEMAGRYTSGKKLSNVFVNYGHASVADMSPVMVFVNEIPMHQAFWMFNHTSVGGGQELSTRYVKLDDLGIPPLVERLGVDVDSALGEKIENKWEDLQSFASERYNHWVKVLRDPLENYLKENTEEGTKISPSTLDARVLDVARMWIPSGAKTSMCLQTNVRNMIDIAGQLRSTGDTRSSALGDQLVTLLELKDYEGFEDMQADLGALTRSKYYEGSEVLANNVDKVKQYILEKTDIIAPDDKPNSVPIAESRTELLKSATPGEATLAQYIAVAFPGLNNREIKNMIVDLSKDEKALGELGAIIFDGHTHHELMRNQGDVRGITASIETSLAYLRDFNRHRAMGRLALFLETDDFDSIINNGFNLNNQIINTEYWNEFEDDWSRDAVGYYEKLFDLRDLLKKEIPDFNSKHLMDIVPLGHQTRMYMSGPSTQWSYLTSLRIGLGGDFGYRKVTWDILENIRGTDPVLAGMARHLAEPDPNDVDQILGRS